jgi:hypothetical protein
MSEWSNIDISPDDPEIIEIDKFKKTLGVIPSNVRQIRELITRFEVCHFKYQQHFKYIKESILNLKPEIDPKKIGTNHIRSGENAWKKDKTGRSRLGQRYVWALTNWIGDNPEVKDVEHYDKKLGQQITDWLGKKNPENERLVRLLRARLIWDEKSYEELLQGKENKELELQVCRMDICHYDFPQNLDLLVPGIGEMKPVEAFEGCGSFNPDIKKFVEKEFSILNDLLKSITSVHKPDKNELIKAWLIACLAKTLKEQVSLTKPIPRLVRKKYESV